MKTYEERLNECKKYTNELSGLCRDIIKRLKNNKCYTEKTEIGILVPYYDKMDRLNSEIYEIKFDMTPNVNSIVYISELKVIGIIIEVSPLNDIDEINDNQYLDITYKVSFYERDGKTIVRNWFRDDEFKTIIYDSLSIDDMIIVTTLKKKLK
jgi:hypothetical protein